jgi:hypothetical protein
MRHAFLVALAVPFLGLAASGEAKDEPADARSLAEVRSQVRLVRVEAMESDPVQFALALEVAMPEPRWTLGVESVSRPDATGRILVRLRGERPEGMLPQVITPTAVRVPLGALPAGEVLVDVLLSAPPRPSRRVGAIALRATP